MYFKVEDRDDPRAVREKITGKLLTLDENLRGALPALLSLLGVPVTDPHWESLAASERRQRILDAVKHLVLRESQVQPVVLLLPHWAVIKALRALSISSSIALIADSLVSGHTPHAHDLTVGDHDFITVECVESLQFDRSKFKAITSKQLTGELSRARLSAGDVVITIKRRIAKAVSVRPGAGIDGAVNQDVAVLKPKPGWSAGYIAAFLCSTYGQGQAATLQTEQMNPYLSLPNLERVVVPRLDGKVQERVAYAAEAVDSVRERGLSEYAEAESELLERLRWTDVAGDSEKSYACRVSRMLEDGRVDAEYFQPRYARLRNHLIRMGAHLCVS
jgi:hypothetical protein